MSSKKASAVLRPSSRIRFGSVGASFFWCLFGQPGCVGFRQQVGALLRCHRSPSCCAAFSTNGAVVSIAALLGRGGPSAVLWRVGAVVINAVNRVLSGWSSAHVGDKRSVGLAPSLADGDTAATVIPIADVALVIAAGFHALPNLVLCCRSRAVALSMLTGCYAGSCSFAPYASTALGASGFQHPALSDGLTATITAAHPLNRTRLRNPGDNHQAAESLPYKALSGSHVFNFTTEEHIAFS